LKQKSIRRDLNILYLIFVIAGLVIASLSPLTPIIAERLQVGYSKIGIAFFIGNIFFLLSTLAGGKLSDRYSTKKVVFYSTLLLSLGVLIFGFYRSYFIFVLALLLIRLGLGSLNVSIFAFPSKLSKIKVSKVFLILNIFWLIGSAIGPLLVSGIIFLNLDPNLLFLFYFLLFLVPVIICLRTGFASNNNVGPAQNMTKNSPRTIFTFIKNPIIVLSSIMLFFFMGGVWGFIPWITTYFLAFKIPVAFSSASLSIYWLFGLVGAIVVNRLIKKFSGIGLLVSICIMSTVSLAITSFSPNIIVKIIFLLILAFSFSGIYPLLTVIPVKEDLKENSGSILGFVISIGFLGQIVFQPIFGYIAEYFGEEFTAFIALAGMGISTILGIILLIILKKRKIEILNPICN